jgi:type I restriction enzyme S subunit
MALSPRSDLIDAHYLYRYMQTVNLSPFAVATSVPSVRRGDVSAIEIPIPPLEEQERIVAKLESMFAKSRLARKELRHVPELVERYKQAVLAAAYRAGLTAAWRKEHADVETALSLVGRTKAPTQPRGGREAAEGIIRGVAALSVNDPGGAVPPGWAWTSLMRIARQETGHTPSRSHPEWWGGDIPWIGIKDANAHHGRVICETLQTTNNEGLSNSAARLLPAGTVCLSRTASVGYVVIMGKDMATSQDFVTWTCTEALLPKYLVYALMAEGDEIRRFGKGSLIRRSTFLKSELYIFAWRH